MTSGSSFRCPSCKQETVLDHHGMVEHHCLVQGVSIGMVGSSEKDYPFLIWWKVLFRTLLIRNYLTQFIHAALLTYLSINLSAVMYWHNSPRCKSIQPEDQWISIRWWKTLMKSMYRRPIKRQIKFDINQSRVSKTNQILNSMFHNPIIQVLSTGVNKV